MLPREGGAENTGGGECERVTEGQVTKPGERGHLSRDWWVERWREELHTGK